MVYRSGVVLWSADRLSAAKMFLNSENESASGELHLSWLRSSHLSYEQSPNLLIILYTQPHKLQWLLDNSLRALRVN
jgi:hypothetical protein